MGGVASGSVAACMRGGGRDGVRFGRWCGVGEGRRKGEGQGRSRMQAGGGEGKGKAQGPASVSVAVARQGQGYEESREGAASGSVAACRSGGGMGRGSDIGAMGEGEWAERDDYFSCSCFGSGWLGHRTGPRKRRNFGESSAQDR